MSMDREQKDQKYLENYEKMRRRWQRYAQVISKKVGKKSPEFSIINAADYNVEDLQKKEDFDEVLANSLQHKLNNFYGNLRLSPLDGKLNRNYVPSASPGGVGKP